MSYPEFSSVVSTFLSGKSRFFFFLCTCLYFFLLPSDTYAIHQHKFHTFYMQLAAISFQAQSTPEKVNKNTVKKILDQLKKVKSGQEIIYGDKENILHLEAGINRSLARMKNFLKNRPDLTQYSQFHFKIPWRNIHEESRSRATIKHP